MTDTTVVQPGTVALEPPSTVLNPETVKATSGGGKTSISAEPGTSIQDVLQTELDSLKAKDAEAAKVKEPDAEKVDPKAKDAPEKDAEKKAEAKPDDKAAKPRAEDGKFAKAEKVEGEEPEPAKADKGAPDQAAAEQESSERGRPSEGRQQSEPPARFLPRAKELWENVPNPVKGEINRMMQEHDAEVTQYRQSHEEWTKLDKFQKMATEHKVTISDALERYTRLDGLLASDPISGIREILATRGITPEQYAQHVLNNPEAHQPRPQAPVPDPTMARVSAETVQLREELNSLKQEQAAATIIAPFRAEHPRFDELQEDIAFFLQSGKIPASLSPSDRLEAAYDMAERINPRSVSAPQPDGLASVAAKPVPSNDAGTKSVRGAPSDGHDTTIEDTSTDLRETLRKELRKITA